MGKKAAAQKLSKNTEPQYLEIEGMQPIKLPTDIPKPTIGRDIALKHKIELSKCICEIYELDLYSLDSICKMVGISPSSFYYWTTKFEEIGELYKEAKKVKKKINLNKLKEIGRSVIQKRIQGERVILRTRKYRKPTDKEGNEIQGVVMMEEITEREVYIPPSDTALQMLLYNVDSDTFEKNPKPGTKNLDDVNISPIEWV